MFRIREFSKFTRVSVKMLRHYDEIGLLAPARIDPQTGYRYYSSDQLPRLNRIIALKDLGFSLEQISTLLDADLPLDEIRGMLRLRQAEIEERLRAEHLRLAQVRAQLEQLERHGRAPRYDVVVRDVAPLLVASLRRTVPSLDADVTAMFEALEAHVARHTARAPSSPLALYHDEEYREEGADVEVAVPIVHPVPEDAGIAVRELPALARAACIVYTGSYDHLADVLRALMVWVEANGFVAAGPVREVYLRFGASDAERLNLPPAFLAHQHELFVTEVQLPIAASEA